MTNILTPARKAQITKKIKTLEKQTISNVIEIGKLLKEFSDGCEHGEYMAWIKTEFSWSQRTTLNYRNVYEFSKLANIANLNITLTALYLVASLKDDDEQAARNAIIKAAKRGRVNYQMAVDIIEQHEPVEPDPPVEPEPELPDDPPDEDDDPDDADTEAQPSKLAATVQEMLDISADDPAWPNIMAKIGAAKLRKIIMTLQAVYAVHCERSSVKAAADRAEHKAKILN